MLPYYIGDRYSAAIKPWILPNFESLVNHEKIKMEFNATVEKISETTVTYKKMVSLSKYQMTMFCYDWISS